MTYLGLHQHELSFSILEDNDPHTLVVLDTSRYMEDPEFPMLDVSLPGMEDVHTIPITPGQLTILNSLLVGYSDYCELPDGIYQLRYSVAPNELVYKCQNYLKTDQLRKKLADYLSTLNLCDTRTLAPVAERVSQIQLLIQGAQLEAGKGNDQLATTLYRKALQLVDRSNDC